MNGITSSTALWYASRATGVVALLLLTAVMVLGILVNRQGRLPGLPRFGATSLHRSVSLLAAVFVAVHVATAIADPFVSIGIVASVVPFVSHYEAFWLGLGAVSLDLMAALIVTSLLRGRIGRRDLAGRALAGLPELARGLRAQHRISHRPAARRAAVPRHRLRGGRRRRAGLAGDRCPTRRPARPARRPGAGRGHRQQAA